MKSLAEPQSRARRGLEGDVQDTVRALFACLQGLSGFTVLDATAMAGEREAGRLEGDLCLADITLAPGHFCDYFGDIAIALIDLLEEQPEARELLRGRTFTRTLH